MADACYTDRYLPASFKGVSFKATDVSSQHGRRGAEGEFPFGETTAYTDLGRKIRTYQLSGRFDTNNHVLLSAALIAVCEAPGPGVLVHPTRGVIISAACKSVRVKDNPENMGGVTEVELEFVEANSWPNGLSLGSQLFGLLLSVIIGPAKDSFSSSYKPSGVQPFRRDAVINAAQNQVENIRDQYLTATRNQPENEDRNLIAFDLQAVADGAYSNDVGVMADTIENGMQAVANETDGSSKYDAFRSIANNAAFSSTFMSPAFEAENAVYTYVRVLAAAYMAEGLLEADNMRASELFAGIDAVKAVIDQELAYLRSTCENDLFIQLSRFRDTALSQLYEKAHNSPALKEYKFGGRVHPLVAAHEIYGDAKQHRLLETLNNVGTGGRFGSTVVAPSM